MDTQKQMEDLSKKVDKILFYLESDEKTKQEGLVEKVGRIDTELDNLLTREKVYLARFSIIAFLGGAIFQLIWVFIQKLFK
jgi:hypothetical protein